MKEQSFEIHNSVFLSFPLSFLDAFLFSNTLSVIKVGVCTLMYNIDAYVTHTFYGIVLLFLNSQEVLVLLGLAYFSNRGFPQPQWQEHP